MKRPVLVVGNRRAAGEFRLYADRLEHEKLGQRALLPLAVITDVYATGPTAAGLVVRGIGGETHEIGGVALHDYDDLQAAIARLRSGEDPRAVAEAYVPRAEQGRGRRALRFSLAAAVLALIVLAVTQFFY